MNKLVLLGILLSVCGYVSASTFSISCETAVVTQTDGKAYANQYASLSSDDSRAILKLNKDAYNLPPATNQMGAYMIVDRDKNHSVLNVTAVDSATPHAASLMVSLKDSNGNAIWSVMAAGCASHHTK